MVHVATGLTPNEARKPANELYLFHGPPEDRARKSRRTCFFKCFHKQGWDRLLKFEMWPNMHGVKPVPDFRRPSTPLRVMQTGRGQSKRFARTA